MNKPRSLIGLVIVLWVIALLCPRFSEADAPAAAAIKLYGFDAGHLAIHDMGMFSDTGEGAGKPGNVVATSWLVRHPKGDLLWDTGLPDALADQPNGFDPPGGMAHLSVTTRLLDQLKAIGVAPADIEFLAFSHMHPDHTGNANAFAVGPTWLLNSLELNYALTTTGASDPASFSAYKTAKKQTVEGDFDVFGDGTVRILRTPGHTPGHRVLQVQLAKAGTVILSGDLYHTHRNQRDGLVPAFNSSRADTLASFDRVARILKNTHGRLIIQHAPEDFAAFPKAPKFLE
jgi:glyoxylase-like metal-dependent hydrolase (beta-lactamase superfamily II)